MSEGAWKFIEELPVPVSKSEVGEARGQVTEGLIEGAPDRKKVKARGEVIHAFVEFRVLSSYPICKFISLSSFLSEFQVREGLWEVINGLIESRTKDEMIECGWEVVYGMIERIAGEKMCKVGRQFGERVGVLASKNYLGDVWRKWKGNVATSIGKYEEMGAGWEREGCGVVRGKG